MTLHADILSWDFQTARTSQQPLSFRQCNEGDLQEFHKPVAQDKVELDSWLNDMNCFDDLKTQTLQGYGG